MNAKKRVIFFKKWLFVYERSKTVEHRPRKRE